MLTRAADESRTARVLELRAAFEARTGSFSPRDSFFEPRSAAFWDDALTSGGFGRELLPDLSAESAAMVEPFARAHRGLFRVEPEDVASLALFLTSDDARACTSHEYFVDAGWR